MTSQIYLILIILFGIIVLINSSYYLFLFSKFAFHKSEKIKQNQQPPISVVIVAKNDAHHLIKSLPLLLTQEYNNYEVVVVNDNSDDETGEILEGFKTKYPNLEHINLNSSLTNIKGKKFPLSIGIRIAKNDIIVLTEPQVIELSPLWLQNIAKHYDHKTEIVLSFATYQKNKGTFNSLLRFEAMYRAMLYFSYALAKIPFMGDGKNLSYSRQLFFKNRGFATHNHILYGEDDLLISKIATKKNCKIEYSPEATLKVKAIAGFKYWTKQQKLKCKTRKFYTFKNRSSLQLFEISAPLFYLFLILSLVFLPSFALHWTLTLAGLFVVKFLVQYLVIGFSARKLNEKEFIPFIIVYDFIFAFLQSFILIASKMKKK